MADNATYSNQASSGSQVFHSLETLTDAMLRDDGIIVLSPYGVVGPQHPTPEGEADGIKQVDYELIDMPKPSVINLEKQYPTKEELFEKEKQIAFEAMEQIVQAAQFQTIPVMIRIWNLPGLACYIERHGSDHLSFYLPSVQAMCDMYKTEKIEEAQMSAMTWSALTKFVLDGLPDGKMKYLVEKLGDLSLIKKEASEADSPHFARAIEMQHDVMKRYIGHCGGTPVLQGISDGKCSLLFRYETTTAGQVSYRLPYTAPVICKDVSRALKRGMFPATGRHFWMVWGHDGDYYYVNPYTCTLTRAMTPSAVVELAARVHGEFILMGVKKFRSLGKEIAEALSGHVDRERIKSLLKGEQKAAKDEATEDGAVRGVSGESEM
jgi:hypothetical protein